jgi:hypothetical protein
MNKKCNDYTFQTNRIPTWISDLIFKYQNTMNALQNVFWVAFLPRHLFILLYCYYIFQKINDQERLRKKKI